MWSNIQNMLAIVPGHAVPIRTAAPVHGAQLDVVMMLSFLTAFLTLVCYLERRRYRWMKFAMGMFLLLNGGFGIAMGAWPLGVLQFVWAGCAFARWWSPADGASRGKLMNPYAMRRRISELHGSSAFNN